MRAALAIATVVLVLLTAAAPHSHASHLGQHGCAACVTAGGEEAVRHTPRVAPLAAPAADVLTEPRAVPASGAPLGAIPGQSPPAA